MYTIRQYEDKFQMYELREESTNSSIQVCPERGGIITSFVSHGDELFYLDKDTFYDATANIRGGNPILFPISGQLKNGEYELAHRTYQMRNHGVARIMPWQVVDTQTEGKGSITLKLVSTSESQEEFPFDFELLFTYALQDGDLVIRQSYRNHSDEDMPMYAGFHPYFTAKHKNIVYHTDAKSYLDYNDMEEKVLLDEFDIAGKKESVTLLGMEQRSIGFDQPEFNRTITMEFGPEFKYAVIWSVEGKDFVCVEPWMAKTWEFNELGNPAGNDLTWVKAGSSVDTVLSIRRTSLK